MDAIFESIIKDEAPIYETKMDAYLKETVVKYLFNHLIIIFLYLKSHASLMRIIQVTSFRAGHKAVIRQNSWHMVAKE